MSAPERQVYILRSPSKQASQLLELRGLLAKLDKDDYARLLGLGLGKRAEEITEQILRWRESLGKLDDKCVVYRLACTLDPPTREDFHDGYGVYTDAQRAWLAAAKLAESNDHCPVQEIRERDLEPARGAS